MGTWDWDPQSNEVDWDETARYLLCGPFASQIQPSVDAFDRALHPEDKESVVQKAMDQVLTNGSLFDTEYRVNLARQKYSLDTFYWYKKLISMKQEIY